MTAPLPGGPPLPTGTVTFLYTDIVGSLSDWSGPGYTGVEAVALHHDVLRRRILQHGGYEVKQAWDQLLAAFASAGDALRAAVAAQCALSPDPQNPWGPEVNMPMRAALHSGDVELQDGEYREDDPVL